MLALDPLAYDDRDLTNTVCLLDEWWRHLAGSDPVPTWAAAGRQAHLAAVATAAERLSIGTPSLKLIAAAAQQPGFLEAARPLLAASLAGLSEAAAERRRLGTPGAGSVGSVAHLAVSNGGVPKRSIDHAIVGPWGLEGDRQRTRMHHGRPWQALCLWSLETIETFAAAGNPIGPGSAGENVTIAGLAWADVLPGVRLRMGEALVEVSVFTLPCSNNAQWFLNRDFAQMHHERGPGLSRLYASVVEPGAISVGDEVELLG
jgi:MOSC domain-containing protein YiiM